VVTNIGEKEMRFSTTIFAALMGFAMLASIDANAHNNHGQLPAGSCYNSPTGSMYDRKTDRYPPTHILSGDYCNIHNPGWVEPTPQDNPKFEVCVNGISLITGLRCSFTPGEWWDQGHHYHGKIKGSEAFHLIRTGRILSSRITHNGWTRLVVKTHRHNRWAMYNCKVSPNGNWAVCYSYN